MAFGTAVSVIDKGSSNNTDANSNDGKIVVSKTDAESLGLSNCSGSAEGTKCGGFSVKLEDQEGQSCTVNGVYVVNEVAIGFSNGVITVDGDMPGTTDKPTSACKVSVIPTANGVYLGSVGLGNTKSSTTGVNNGAGEKISVEFKDNTLKSGTEYNIYCATNDTIRVLSTPY